MTLKQVNNKFSIFYSTVSLRELHLTDYFSFWPATF